MTRNRVRSGDETLGAVDTLNFLIGDERKERDRAAKTRAPFLKVWALSQVCRRRGRSLRGGRMEDGGC